MVYEEERERIEIARGRREPRHRSQVPSSLNDGDVGALNEVRRTVWRNGVQGLLVGSVVGSGGCLAAKHFKLMKVTPAHWMFGTLAVGALGSFVGALVAGKNSSFLLEGVMKRGSTGVSYMRSVEGAFEAERDESHRRRVEQIKKATRFKEQQEHLAGGAFVSDGVAAAPAQDAAGESETSVEEVLWVDANMNIRREYK